MGTPCNCNAVQKKTRGRRRYRNRTCYDHENTRSDEIGLNRNNWIIHETNAIAYSRIDWAAAKEAVLSPLHNLLSSPGLPCLTCGKMISGKVKAYPEICSSCYAAIPWIVNPKCEICGRPVGCPDCSRKEEAHRRFLLNRSAVAYNAPMREWLAQYKFRGNERLGDVMARMTGWAASRLVKELGEMNGGEPFCFDAVTYVPISGERMLERGFNQARTLAVQAAAVCHAPLLELLGRTLHTEKQSFKSRWQRLRDLSGVFAPASDAGTLLNSAISRHDRKAMLHNIHDQPKTSHPAPLRLLLVDDVYTTGSTIDTCAAVLQELCVSLGHPAEIYSLTWARS